MLLALGTGSGSLDRGGRGDGLALSARDGRWSRGARGLSLGAGGRLCLSVVTALEEGSRAGVDSRRLSKSRGLCGGGSSLSRGALAHSVGLGGCESLRDLGRGSDGDGLGSRGRLDIGRGSGADAEDRRAVGLAIIALEERSYIRNGLAFGRQLGSGCTSRSQKDERAGEHYD